jgi:hypothetical protein
VRKSGVVSTSTRAPPLISNRIEGRLRRSRGSWERHVSQRQPIIGTPCEVPVPRNLTAQLALTAG